MCPADENDGTHESERMMQDYIVQSLEDSIRVKQTILNDAAFLREIDAVGQSMTRVLSHGGKILLCGNGGSAADAQHLAAELVGRFSCEREGLPAIALTTDTSILTAVGNDYGYDRVFERQTAALGRKGDILIGISTSGDSPNVEHALQTARAMGLITVGLLGKDGGRCRALCDHALVVPHRFSARIQEAHITIGHILCGIVDRQMPRKP